MKLMWLVSIFIFSASTALASSGTTIPKDTTITVTSYESNLHLFVISINDTPDIGPNAASPRSLKEALGMEGSVKDFLNKKDQVIGSVYVLHKDLHLAAPPTLSSPKKKRKK